jgi:HD superfamily phosphodiesterase
MTARSVRSIVGRADDLAERAHRGQVRKGTSDPYVEHPRAVARIVADAGGEDEAVAAALLHDVVEDAGVPIADLERDFGVAVASVVRDLSEDKSLSWEERKRHTLLELPGLAARSALVALADRLDNMRRLNDDAEAHGDALWQRFNAPLTRQRRYYRSLGVAFEARADLATEPVAELRSLVDAVFPPTPVALELLVAAVHDRTTSAGSHVHGEAHWRTVAAVGRSLLDVEPTADPAVVLSFALLHDSMRLNDHQDPEHGPRAAELARELQRDGVLRLHEHQLSVLTHALDHHTSGFRADDPTTAVCWDADRLLLWRVGINPDPSLLSSDVADWTPWIDRWHDVWAQDDWPALQSAFAGLE